MFITRPRIASQNSDEKTCMYRWAGRGTPAFYCSRGITEETSDSSIAFV